VTQNLLTHPGYWRWLAGGQAARLPDIMAPLAFTTAAAAVWGSAAAGGAMVTALVVAEVAFAVPVGRLMDRIGVARAARILLLARGFAYLGLLTAILARLPMPALVGLAAIPGALGAGILGGFRALLSGVVAESMLSRAVSVNSMAVDGVITAGPLLVAALGAVSSGPLLAVFALSVVAVGLVPRSPTEARPGRGHGRLARPLIGWAISAFVVGHLCSTVEVAALPIAQRLGAGPGSAAMLIAVFSVASIAGSVVYTVRKSAGAARMAVALLITMAAGGALIASAQGRVGILVGLVAAGICIGPIVTINSIQAERCMPADRR
jgi:MFS family permease